MDLDELRSITLFTPRPLRDAPWTSLVRCTAALTTAPLCAFMKAPEEVVDFVSQLMTHPNPPRWFAATVTTVMATYFLSGLLRIYLYFPLVYVGIISLVCLLAPSQPFDIVRVAAFIFISIVLTGIVAFAYAMVLWATGTLYE